MNNNNLAILTRAHTAIAAKRRARREQLKEVVFDDDARRYAPHPTPAPLQLTLVLQGISYRLSQAKASKGRGCTRKGKAEGEGRKTGTPS